nr:hypothetical protein [Escherichia coli]
MKRRKPPKPKKEKSSSREGDYMEGAEGNVFVLRQDLSERAGSKTRQQRQNGSSYNAEPHHSPSRWRVDAQNSIPKCMAR